MRHRICPGIAPQQISLMFSVIVAAMIFFGCAYYPWQGLSAVAVLRWAVHLRAPRHRVSRRQVPLYRRAVARRVQRH